VQGSCGEIVSTKPRKKKKIIKRTVRSKGNLLEQKTKANKRQGGSHRILNDHIMGLQPRARMGGGETHPGKVERII